MAELLFAELPDLPQSIVLKELLPAIWNRREVQALWLGGSLARKNADLYSDVDLRLSVTPESLESWTSPVFETLFSGHVLAHQTLDFGAEVRFHHLLLANGDIYDLWIQTTERPVQETDILVLGCRDEALLARLRFPPPPAAPPLSPAHENSLRTLMVWFWINSHKHRKVLHRNLNLLVLTGLHNEQATLLRLWYALATGQDPGEVKNQTIYSLSEQARIVEQARGAEALTVLGACCSDRISLLRTIQRNRDAVSDAGRQLAALFDFEYPATLEQMVRREWESFLSR